jgi:gentisate 1,2-dioxygenase
MENMNPKFDDDQYGRARVKKSEELEKYYAEIQKLGTNALWTVANEIEPWEPHTLSSVMFWEYEKIRPHLLRSTELVTPGEAGRRVLYLVNEKRKDIKAACGMLFSGLQITKPGEFTPAHRHVASALRFIMEGEKGYTIVDGHHITLSARDFVITPNGTWHEHGVEEDGKTCIWQDGLDIPMANAFEANDYAILPEGKGQDRLFPTNFSPLTYGGVGVLPADKEWNKPFSPLFKYTWERTYEALLNMAKVNDGSPFDGILMNYVNPTTGGPVMQTMGAAMQLLRPQEHTKAHKHTGSIVYQCAKGKGYSIINGIKYYWKEKDIFCVPSWTWHEHCNESDSEDACLFQFNDLPTIHKLGYYQEKEYTEHGGYQKVISTH